MHLLPMAEMACEQQEKQKEQDENDCLPATILPLIVQIDPSPEPRQDGDISEKASGRTSTGCERIIASVNPNTTSNDLPEPSADIPSMTCSSLEAGPVHSRSGGCSPTVSRIGRPPPPCAVGGRRLSLPVNATFIAKFLI